MTRNRLAGSLGDAANTVLAAVGFPSPAQVAGVFCALILAIFAGQHTAHRRSDRPISVLHGRLFMEWHCSGTIGAIAGRGS